jgi:hypothetical protein
MFLVYLFSYMYGDHELCTVDDLDGWHSSNRRVDVSRPSLLARTVATDGSMSFACCY